MLKKQAVGEVKGVPLEWSVTKLSEKVFNFYQLLWEIEEH